MVVGCGSDSGSAAGSGGSAGTGGAGGQGGAGGATGGAAPVITEVQWAPVGSCAQGTPSDYTVTVTATDADSDQMDLIYDGSVTSCIPGEIDDETSTITCPNAVPYGGMVVVEDDDGNVSTPVNFTIGVCETSSTLP
jgi:hypothetical protein